jgi:outer membrane protein assembly factor BamB
MRKSRERRHAMKIRFPLIPFLLAATVLWVGPFGVLGAQELRWRRALGGSIGGYPAQGPGGNVYIVADDRALHSINPDTGDSNWIYRPGGRLRTLLMVAPDGTIYVQNDREELYAVTPGGTGRWKLRMNREPAALPAAAPDGRIIVPLAGGRIVGVSRHGVILWSHDESAEASAGPITDSSGTSWIPLTDGRIIAIDSMGVFVAETRMRGAVSVMSLDHKGRIWAGAFDGRVAVFDTAQAAATDQGPGIVNPQPIFEIRPGSSRVVSILTDSHGSGRIFLADGTLADVDSAGRETGRSRVALSGGSPSAAGDGTIYAPSSDGSIRVVFPDGEQREIRGGSVLAEPLLTEEGILIAGGGDWILYAWNASPPGEGWRQFRGSGMRSGTFPSVYVEYDRVAARKDPGFFYREKMALSDDLGERMALLDELESFPESFAMRREMPWAGLLLEDLVSVGTIRRVDAERGPVASHPSARARAYLIIAESEDFRSRGLLLDSLKHEDDPAALAAGFIALGRLGSDWDGASLRLIARRYREFMPAGERLTLAAVRALAELVKYNGSLSDPAGYMLMDDLLRSPVSRRAGEEVIAVIRGIAAF